MKGDAITPAAHTAVRHPHYQPVLARQLARHGRKRGRKIAVIDVAHKLAERMRTRHGNKRGTKIAVIEIARRNSQAIWHMLNNNQPFAPAGAKQVLTA